MPPPEVLTNDQLFGSWDLKKGGYTPEIVKKIDKGIRKRAIQAYIDIKCDL